MYINKPATEDGKKEEKKTYHVAHGEDRGTDRADQNMVEEDNHG